MVAIPFFVNKEELGGINVQYYIFVDTLKLKGIKLPIKMREKCIYYWDDCVSDSFEKPDVYYLGLRK